MSGVSKGRGSKTRTLYLDMQKFERLLRHPREMSGTQLDTGMWNSGERSGIEIYIWKSFIENGI